MHAIRTERGHITELAAALIILVAMLGTLISLAFVPVRYMFCQGVIAERAALLAHCEKRSDIYQSLKQDKSWKSTLGKVGVLVRDEEAFFVVTTNDGKQKTTIKEGAEFAKEWLPNATRGPFIYSVMLKAKCAIAPGITFPVSGDSQWDNLSPNPKTRNYFISE